MLVLVVDPRDGVVGVRPTAVLRIAAHLLAARLDAQLAAGRPPESSRLLAVRAAQLVSPPVRRRLARDIEALLLAAAGQVHHPRTVLSPRWDEVLRAEDEFGVLVQALRRPVPVPAQGMARAHQIVVDGTGPLYCAGGDLRRSVHDAVDALEPLHGWTS